MKLEVPEVDIEALFDHYGLRIASAGRGAERKAQCPFPDHEDANPSASVNTDDNTFFCHTCGEGGDSITIIRKRESLAGWADVVRWATHFVEAGGGSLPRERVRSSLLPGGSGNRRNRGAWTPPWKGL